MNIFQPSSLPASSPPPNPRPTPSSLQIHNSADPPLKNLSPLLKLKMPSLASKTSKPPDQMAYPLSFLKNSGAKHTYLSLPSSPRNSNLVILTLTHPIQLLLQKYFPQNHQNLQIYQSLQHLLQSPYKDYCWKAQASLQKYQPLFRAAIYLIRGLLIMQSQPRRFCILLRKRPSVKQPI